MNALNVLCAQLTRDLFAIAKFLYKWCYCQVQQTSIRARYKTLPLYKFNGMTSEVQSHCPSRLKVL